MDLLWFFVGLLAGGAIGVLIMCIIQAGRYDRSHSPHATKKETNEE